MGYPLTSLHDGASNHYNVVQGPNVWMRPPETIWTHLDPSETLWRPLEVGGEAWRPLQGYMYTYILLTRSRTL